MNFSALNGVRLFSLFLLLAVLPSCISMLEPPPARPGPGEDVGPKPSVAEAAEIAARWANQHYAFLPPAPFTPDEFSFTEPTPVVYHDLLMGKAVGWQIILGPENKRLSYMTEMSYTRLIINYGRIVSIVSSDQRFAEPR